jgi:hypothetical protein
LTLHPLGEVGYLIDATPAYDARAELDQPDAELWDGASASTTFACAPNSFRAPMGRPTPDVRFRRAIVYISREGSRNSSGVDFGGRDEKERASVGHSVEGCPPESCSVFRLPMFLN